MIEMRVWVGCLACYNAGQLVGEWFDAELAPTEMTGEDGFDNEVSVPVSHKMEQHEELWVMDHEGFHGLIDGECSPVEAKELAEFLGVAFVDESEIAAFAAYVDNIYGKGFDYEEALEGFREAYQGEHANEEDFAYELASEFIDMRNVQWPTSHIDWEAAARDLFMGGDYFSAPAPGGNLYIFRSI